MLLNAFIFVAIHHLLDEPVLVRWAVLALSNLCDEHTVLTIASKGTLDALKQSLRTYNKNHKIVSVVCVALGNIAHSDHLRSAISSNTGLIQHVINAMNQHMSKSEVQHRCSYAVGKIASGNNDNKHKFIVHGVLRTLAFAMHAYPNNEDIARRITFAIANLAYNNELAQRQILRAGLLQLIVASMHSHAESGTVQQYCCRALNAIVYGNEDARTAALQHNALAAVTEALAHFQGDSNVQASCNVAMDSIFPTTSHHLHRGRTVLYEKAEKNTNP